MAGELKPSEKYTLLIKEAAEYFGIGICRPLLLTLPLSKLCALNLVLFFL